MDHQEFITGVKRRNALELERIGMEFLPLVERAADLYINKLIYEKASKLLPEIEYEWGISEVYEHPMLKEKIPSEIELPDIIGYIDLDYEYGGGMRFNDTEYVEPSVTIRRTVFVTPQGKCFQLSDTPPNLKTQLYYVGIGREHGFQQQSTSDFEDLYEDEGVVKSRFCPIRYNIFMRKLLDYCPMTLEAYRALEITYYCDSCLARYSDPDLDKKADFTDCQKNNRCCIFHKFQEEQKWQKEFTLREFKDKVDYRIDKSFIKDTSGKVIGVKTGALFLNTRSPSYNFTSHMGELKIKTEIEHLTKILAPRSFLYGLQYYTSQKEIDELKAENVRLKAELAKHKPSEEINVDKRIMMYELFRRATNLLEFVKGKPNNLENINKIEDVISIIRLIKNNFESYVF